MKRFSTGLVSPAVDALEQVAAWPARRAAVAVTRAEEELGAVGPRDELLPWASVTKLLTALAALVAVEEGVVDLDAAAGPEGSTNRHLLAHASGLATDHVKPIARPGRRRIYSNAGFEVLAAAVEHAAEMPFADYIHVAVLGPLGLSRPLRG